MPWSTSFVGLGNRHLRVRVDRANRSGNSRELPSKSAVPLSLNSYAGAEQAPEKVSHSRRDWEEDGRSEIPLGIEKHWNAANRG